MYSPSPVVLGAMTTAAAPATLAYTGLSVAHAVVFAAALIAFGTALWRLAPRRAHADS